MTLNGVGGQIAKGMHYAPGIEAVADDGLGRARFGPVHARHWQTDLFASWLLYYAGRPWAPPPEALQVITLGRSGRWQDDSVKRWRRDRLDRAPHLPATARRR
jgi:hypothetical protein